MASYPLVVALVRLAVKPEITREQLISNVTNALVFRARGRPAVVAPHPGTNRADRRAAYKQAQKHDTETRQKAMRRIARHADNFHRNPTESNQRQLNDAIAWACQEDSDG